MATPQITITGNFKDLTGTSDAGSVQAALVNYGSDVPRVAGTSILNKLSTTAQAALNGAFSMVLWGNDIITPAGTYYLFTFFNDAGNQVYQAAYSLTGSGSFDLSNLSPISSTTAIVPAPPSAVLLNPTGFQTITGFGVAVPQLQTPDVMTKGIPHFDVRAYGAIGNNTTDDTVAIQNASAAAGATGILYFPPGLTFKTSGTVVVTGNVYGLNSTISYTGTGVAVQVNISFTAVNGYVSVMPQVIRPARLWSSGSPSTDSGIQFLNSNGNTFVIPAITRFTYGLDLSPSGFGVARNIFHLGNLNNNMIGLRFAPATVNGFTNQNLFLGGYWANDTTLGWAVPGTRDILMSANASAQVTSNVFINPDLEGQVSEYMVESWGQDNRIINGEWENPIARSVSDATVTSGSPTITLTAGDVAAGKGFNANADIGAVVTGGLFPGGTTIASVTNSTTATASANATSNGSTVTISSFPRVAYRNSSGNTAQRNVIEGGFAIGGMVITKDAGVLSNEIIYHGPNGNHYVIADGGSATFGRGTPSPFNGLTLPYGLASPQLSAMQLPTAAGDGASVVEGSIGAGVANANNVTAKLFVNDDGTTNGKVWGLLANGNVVTFPFVIAQGSTEMLRVLPNGQIQGVLGSSANPTYSFGTNGSGFHGVSTTIAVDIGNALKHSFNSNINVLSDSGGFSIGAASDCGIWRSGAAATFAIGNGTQGNNSGTLNLRRLKSSGGTALVAGDFALSAGWGTTATVTGVIGTDQGWTITVTSSGTGQAANPTITLTFHDGTWTNSPITVTKMSGGTGTLTQLTEAPTATTNVITFQGTPVAASTYIISSVGMGR